MKTALDSDSNSDTTFRSFSVVAITLASQVNNMGAIPVRSIVPLL